MKTGNNVIDNDNVSLTSNNNINVNDSKNRKLEQAKKVDVIVADLVRKFHVAGITVEAGSMLFLYRAAWHLSEAALWNNFEKATNKNGKITNPFGLFIFLCKRDGV